MLNRASLSSLRLFCNLRWLGIAGQALAVTVATGPMHIALQPLPLWSGVAALTLFNVYAWRRTRKAEEPGSAEIFCHILVDIIVLTWMVFWSGGMENPFLSLFLLPMALSVLALPAVWVWCTTAASIAGYLVSALFGNALPHVHGAFGNAFSLHKAGMMANFAVSALVIVVFFSRMASAWREHQREMARLREQFARDEGILALATHAASVAHELNTPLGTLMLMVDDLVNEAQTDAQREEYLTLKALLGVCRDRVRELAAPADGEGGDSVMRPVHLDRVIERWQLIRPTIDLHRSGSIAGNEMVDPAVGYLLQALLNNAADASQEAGSARVDLELNSGAQGVRGDIRDYGRGFGQAQPALPSQLFRTSKPEGMGIGLALSHATVERLGGELNMRATEGQGVRISFALPLPAGS